MAKKSDIRCTNPRCVECIEKWGEHYHGVYESDRKKQILCENCGGVYDGEKFTYTCEKCKIETDELFGLFVPHLCKGCQNAAVERDRKTNNRCLKCGALRIECCC